MAHIIYDFYNGTDVYNDGTVEQKLLDYYRNDSEIDMSTDEMFYLTTHIRSNILNWYPFTKNDTVLEIGSGCGTLTGMLCEKCNSVCSVEGSKRRAEITFERNNEYENLEVFAAEFGKFELNRKFDYVILIGVFEYAKRFFDKKEPANYFLSEIKKVLKPSGKVIIAIENRYGLKYWAGANEDHLLMPYVGFSDYKYYDVETYGKKEFVDLIRAAGFEKYKYYYPFPDYKLPELVYTDERLPKQDEIATLPIYVYGNKTVFDIKSAYAGLVENDEFGFFSNSFVIEFGYSDAKMSDVVYAKELSYRKEKYRIVTVQNGSGEFHKIAVTEAAKEHVRNIYEIYQKMIENNIPVAPIKNISDNEIQIEFCEGKSVADITIDEIKSQGMNCFSDELDKLLEFYKTISVKKAFENPMDQEMVSLYPEGAYVLKLSLIDGNASNIIKKDEEYTFIDQEWLADGELPVEYLMYYSILHIGNVGKIEYSYVLEMLDQYGISEEHQRVFNKVSQEFYEKQGIIDNDTKEKQLALEESGNEIDTFNTNPVCYFDTGKDFNEEEKLYGSYEKNGEYFEAKFELPQGVKRMRIDPALCGERMLQFSEILINGVAAEYKTFNIVKQGNNQLLVKRYPYIIIDGQAGKVSFMIDLKKMTETEIENYLHVINEV